MSERLSFYVPVRSPVHELNPLTKLTIVFTFIVMAFFPPYRWIAPLLVIPILILCLVGRVQRQYFSVALKLILPAVLFMFVMQSIFLPGGKQVLFAVGIFDVTMESTERAFYTVSRIFVMISSFALLLLTTHPSALMSDLTRRGLPGQFAYVVVSTLQIIPQMQAKAQTIIAAQRSRGLETEGGFSKRVRALVPLVGPLVFGSLVEVEERAIAIEARGFTSHRAKTFLREIPDLPVDKFLRACLLFMIVLTLVSRIWLS